jgi:hypothetical protein
MKASVAIERPVFKTSSREKYGANRSQFLSDNAIDFRKLWLPMMRSRRFFKQKVFYIISAIAERV